MFILKRIEKKLDLILSNMEKSDSSKKKPGISLIAVPEGQKEFIESLKKKGKNINE